MFSGHIAELIKYGEIQGFQVNTNPPKTFFPYSVLSGEFQQIIEICFSYF